MALRMIVERGSVNLDEHEERRIERHLQALSERLAPRSDPQGVLVLSWHPAQRRVQADLRLRLGPLGPHLVCHRVADTADQAVRLAVEGVERQLERQNSRQRGEPRSGVPGRRPLKTK